MPCDIPRDDLHVAIFTLTRFPAALVCSELSCREILVAVFAFFLLRLGCVLGVLIAKLFVCLQLPGHATFAAELAVHGAAIAVGLVRGECITVKAFEAEGALQAFFGFSRFGRDRGIRRRRRFLCFI
jgi:hypothetical protein